MADFAQPQRKPVSPPAKSENLCPIFRRVPDHPTHIVAATSSPALAAQNFQDITCPKRRKLGTGKNLGSLRKLFRHSFDLTPPARSRILHRCHRYPGVWPT